MGRRIWLRVRRALPEPAGWAASVLVVGGVCLLLVLAWRKHPPDGLVMSGMFQGDFPTYLCYGRSAAQSPTTLSYAMPMDIREPPHPVLVNLPITAIAWLLMAHVRAESIEMVLRVVFGMAMYLALFQLLTRVFGRTAWRWIAFAAIGIGAGVAWAWVIHERPDGAGPIEFEWLRRAVGGFEVPYRGWFLDLMRNLTYPLELCYHALVFLLLDAMVAKRWGRAVFWQAMCALSNPYLGIQFCAVTMVAMFLARGPSWRARAGTLAVTATMVAYYQGLLALDESYAALRASYVGWLQESLSGVDFFVGHAVPLFGLLGLLFDGRFRREVRRSGAVLPFLALFLVTLGLVEHSRLPITHTVFPMHYTRGYMHVALWAIALLWLRSLARRRRWLAPPVFALALVAIAAVLPDNFIFWYDQANDLPHVPSLVWTPEWQATIDRLASMPGRRHVIALDPSMGRHVCALTPHRSAFGTQFITPHYGDRVIELNDFKSRPDAPEPPTVHWADTILVPGSDWSWKQRMRTAAHWREDQCNTAWCIYVRR